MAMYPPYIPLTFSQAESLLREYLDVKTEEGRSKIRHSYAVSTLAIDFGFRCILSGVPCDLAFVATSALLHDLGRYKKTKKDMHMFIGEERLKERGYPNHARVAGVHGLAKEAAETYGISGEYEPKTIEEKVVVLADFCIIGDGVMTVDERFECLRNSFLGRGLYQRVEHLEKAWLRIKDLGKELMELWVKNTYLRTYVDDVRRFAESQNKN